MMIAEDRLRVLLVEDNPGDVALVQLYLKQEERTRIELRCAQSLSQARNVLSDEGFELVLLDLELPDGSGVEVVGSMRRMAIDVPIVVLTSGGGPDAGLEALKSDAQDYLLKDQLNASMLSRSIHFAVERHRWQQQYRQQLSVSPDGTIVLDEDGRVKFANSAAAGMLGQAPSRLAELPEAIREMNGSAADVTLPTGRIVEARGVATRWQGQPARLVTLRDMTERRSAEQALSRLTDELTRSNARLEALVCTDPLTQALNRRGVEEALGREVERMARTGDQAIAILIDCDDFKGINDAYGHAVGDAALTALTRSVRETLRTGDHIGRVGGDEFLVLLPATSIAEGMAVAEKLRQAIKATTLPVADGSVRLSASLAVGMVEQDTVSIEQVLSSVNVALRRSKRGGKDRVSREWLDGAAGDDAPPEARLVVDSLDLGVALQAIRRIEDERVVGYEALARGAPGPLNMPADLFRAAFEQNTLTTIDLRALAASLTLLGELRPEGWYHVNVFPSTVLNTPPDRIVQFLRGNFEPERLCVEISEQQFLGDPTYLRDPLAAVREHGIRVAIDDVGFGRSSIEALLVLEPDVVKVDRRCVRAIATHPGERRQLERLLAMLRAVGAVVIVEGVETAQELAILKDLGVEYAQGFLWGLPTPRRKGSRRRSELLHGPGQGRAAAS